MAKGKKNGNGNGKGTDLAVIEPANYPALNPDSDLAEAMTANVRGQAMQESDLIRVPTPAGGSTKWIVPGDSGEEAVNEIIGLLVYFAPRGTLWPTQEVSDSRPLLVSADLLTATRVGDDYGDIDPDELEKYRSNPGNEPAVYDWSSLPWNEFGTGKDGSGKRCKESRLLFLLREGEPFPLLIRAQPGSLKTIRPFIMRLTVPHWRAVIGLSLQEAKSKAGKKYAQIVPRLVGTLPKDFGEKVRETYTGPLQKMTAGQMESDSEDE